MDFEHIERACIRSTEAIGAWSEHTVTILHRNTCFEFIRASLGKWENINTWKLPKMPNASSM